MTDADGFVILGVLALCLAPTLIINAHDSWERRQDRRHRVERNGSNGEPE